VRDRGNRERAAPYLYPCSVETAEARAFSCLLRRRSKRLA